MPQRYLIYLLDFLKKCSNCCECLNRVLVQNCAKLWMGGLCNTDGWKVNNYIEIYLNAKQSDLRWIYHWNRVILTILNKRNNSLCCLLGSKDWTQNMRLGWRLRSFWKTVSSTHSSMIATVKVIWMYFLNFNGGCHNYVHVVTLRRDYSH